MRLHILTCNESGAILVKAVSEAEQGFAQKAHGRPDKHHCKVVQLPIFSCLSLSDNRYHYLEGLKTAKKHFFEIGAVEFSPLTHATEFRPVKTFELAFANDFVLPVSITFNPNRGLPSGYLWTKFEASDQLRFPGLACHEEKTLALIQSLLPLFQLEPTACLLTA